MSPRKCVVATITRSNWNAKTTMSKCVANAHIFRIAGPVNIFGRVLLTADNYGYLIGDGLYRPVTLTEAGYDGELADEMDEEFGDDDFEDDEEDELPRGPLRSALAMLKSVIAKPISLPCVQP